MLFNNSTLQKSEKLRTDSMTGAIPWAVGHSLDRSLPVHQGLS